MKFKTRLFVLLSIMLISACGAPIPTPTLANATKTLPAVTVSESQVPIMTETPVKLSTQESFIKRQCLDISTNVKLIQGLDKGSIILQQDITTSILYQKLDSPYIYKVDTGEKIILQNASFPVVSLDNNQLAYITGDEKLIVADSNNKTILAEPFKDFEILKWVNGGLLVDVNGQGQQAFLDLSNGERRLLYEEDFPNLHQPDSKQLPYWSPIPIYSPDLTKVVYISSNNAKSETYITLWDINSQKELATVSHGIGLSIASEMRPEWSSDGEQVIIQTFGGSTGKRERKLVSIHKDGTVRTLLTLSRDMAAMRYSISPDQKKLAFWSPDPSSFQITNLGLFILDMQTGAIIDYCISSPELTEKPVWSPDSQSVVIEQLMSDLENSDVVVLDLTKNIAVRIAEDASPIGWMVAP